MKFSLFLISTLLSFSLIGQMDVIKEEDIIHYIHEDAELLEEYEYAKEAKRQAKVHGYTTLGLIGLEGACIYGAIKSNEEGRIAFISIAAINSIGMIYFGITALSRDWRSDYYKDRVIKKAKSEMKKNMSHLNFKVTGNNLALILCF